MRITSRNILCFNVLICFLLSSQLIKAQFYVTGDDPASLTWRQYKTDAFRVIFPADDSLTAFYFSSYLSKYYHPLHQSIQSNERKWNVVMHTRSLRSNGLVSWAPARMELMSFVPDDVYNQPWLEQLAIHEGRHMVQLSRMHTGLTGTLYYIFGEQITGGIAGAYLPSWFMEGDAVYAETVFSKAGRGRSLRFLAPIKSMAGTASLPSYDKMTFGSYKDYSPGSYAFGYCLTSWARTKTSKHIWDSVLVNVARMPFNPFAFSNGIKKQSGWSKYKFYDEWRKSQSVVSLSQDSSKSLVISPAKSVYTNYFSAYRTADSSVYSVKSAWNDVTQIVRLHNNEEQRVYTPASWYPESIRFNDSIAAWLEFRPHWRWTHDGYTRLRVLHLKSKESGLVGEFGRYSSLALSADNSKYLVVEQGSALKSSLNLWTYDGSEKPIVLIEYQNAVILSPVFLNDSLSSVAYIVLDDSGKRIEKLSDKGKKKETLFFVKDADIFQLFARNDSLFFICESENESIVFGIFPDNLRPVVLYKSFSAISGISIGADSRLIISEYDANGYSIRQSTIQKNPDVLMQLPSSPIADSMSLSEQFLNDDSVRFSIVHKPYNKLSHLFGVHSWGPVSTKADDGIIKPGIAVLSQNLLGTFISEAGFEYGQGDTPWKFFADFSYTAWYTALSVQTEYMFRQKYVDYKGQKVLMKWFENSLDCEIYLPVNLSRGRWSRTLYPSFTIGFRNIDQREPDYLRFKYNQFMNLEYRLYFAQLLRSPQQNLMPSYGQIFDFRVRTTPLTKSAFGKQYSFEFFQFFPGLFKHHGLRLYGGFELFSDSADNTYFGRIINEPRGFGLLPNGNAIAAGINYALPLAYPDLSIPWIIYLKRIRAAVFTDFVWVENVPFNTIGIECMSDLHIFGFPAPVEAGVRTSYVPDSKTLSWDILFRIRFDKLK